MTTDRDRPCRFPGLVADGGISYPIDEMDEALAPVPQVGGRPQRLLPVRPESVLQVHRPRMVMRELERDVVLDGVVSRGGRRCNAGDERRQCCGSTAGPAGACSRGYACGRSVARRFRFGASLLSE